MRRRASSTGTPSTVTPTARRSSRPITATIWGNVSNRSRTGSASLAARTTANDSQLSRQRRGSPATSPPSASATPPTSSHARLSSSPRLGRASCSRDRASSRRCSVFGPMPGASRSRPAAAASRNCSAVLSQAPSPARSTASRSIPGSVQAPPARARARARAAPARRSHPSRSARAAAPRSRGRSRAARGRAPSEPDQRSAAAYDGSSRPHACTRGRCKGLRRQARAVRRKPPGGLRSASSPLGLVSRLRQAPPELP